MNAIMATLLVVFVVAMAIIVTARRWRDRVMFRMGVQADHAALGPDGADRASASC